MESLEAIVARVFGIEVEQINDSLSQESIEKWDSFQHLLLMSEIEASLGIDFSASDIEKARSIKALKEIVAQKGE